MKYAVIKIDHRQYIVEEGKEYTVDKFPVAEGEKAEFDVLMISDNGKVEVGEPSLKAKATLEVVTQGKGEKIKTNVYKAKSRYRRSHGHRQRLTKFKVVSIK